MAIHVKAARVEILGKGLLTNYVLAHFCECGYLTDEGVVATVLKANGYENHMILRNAHFANLM